MADQIDELLVKLSADASEFEDGLKDSAELMDKFSEHMKKRAEMIRRLNMTPSDRVNNKMAETTNRITSSLSQATSAYRQLNSAAEKLGASHMDDSLLRDITATRNALRNELIQEIEKAKAELQTLGDNTRLRGELLTRIAEAQSELKELDDDAKKTRTSLRAIASKSWHIVVSAKDMVTGTIGRIKNTLFSLPMAIGAGGTVALTAASTINPLKMAGEEEQSKIAFETMLKSPENATKFLGDLSKFAEDTPFELPQLKDTAKKMLAFKFAAEDVIPNLTGIGNAAAGLSAGEEGVSRIATALGQMKAKGKVSAEEMMQLTEVGISGWDILARKMNTTTSAVMKLSEKGLLPADKAIKALIEGMNEDFPNLMEKQSKSLLGLASRIKETFSQRIVLKWGEGLAAALKPRFEAIGRWIDQNGATIDRWGATLQRAADEGADWVLKKFEGAYKYIKENFLDNPKFQELDFGGKLKFAFNKLTQEFKGWLDTSGKEIITDFSNRFVNGLVDAIKTATPAIVEALVPIVSAVLKGSLTGVIESFKTETPEQKVEKQVETIKKLEALKPGESYLKGPTYLTDTPFKESPWDSIKNFIKNPVGSGRKDGKDDSRASGTAAWAEPHAKGGILTRPHLGMVAEAGPEAIIPLSAGKRSRAASLWEKTGELLGMSSAGSQEGMNQDPFAGMKVTPYARGGILTRPHLGLVAEAGPEAIIPLSSRMRSRALALYEQAGQALGVRPYAEGGMVSAGGVLAAGSGGSGGLTVNVSGVNVSFTSDSDEQTIVNKLGWKLWNAIKQHMENSDMGG